MDPLAALLEEHLVRSTQYQVACLRYIIGSIAAYGKVDACALSTIRRACRDEKVWCLTELMNSLNTDDDFKAVVQFAAERITLEHTLGFLQFFLNMVRANWRTMQGLVMGILTILKGDEKRRMNYYLMLRLVPTERQYEMVQACEVSLDTIGGAYRGGQYRPLLREIFFLARCSQCPSPVIRRYIGGSFPDLEESLAVAAPDKFESPCPSNIPTLNEDSWRHIFTFLDSETLILVLPSVCRLWHMLYSEVLTNNTNIHDLYMMDLCILSLDTISTATPWKYCLQKTPSHFKYLWRCVANGALERSGPVYQLQSAMKVYLQAVADLRAPLPNLENHLAPYGTFLALFEMVYDFCDKSRPVLERPKFFTTEEYYRAVHHFVYEKRWDLVLSGSLIFDDLPRLFEIIHEDEELMSQLIHRYFASFLGASAALILYGQKNEIPYKLGKLVFSQTDAFRRLVGEQLMPSSEHYDFIVESGIFPDLIRVHDRTVGLRNLIVSLVVSFRNNSYQIDRIVESMENRFPGPGNEELEDLRLSFGRDSWGTWNEFKGHSADDIKFFREVMVRCRIMRISKA